MPSLRHPIALLLPLQAGTLASIEPLAPWLHCRLHSALPAAQEPRASSGASHSDEQRGAAAAVSAGFEQQHQQPAAQEQQQQQQQQQQQPVWRSQQQQPQAHAPYRPEQQQGNQAEGEQAAAGTAPEGSRPLKHRRLPASEQGRVDAGRQLVQRRLPSGAQQRRRDVPFVKWWQRGPRKAGEVKPVKLIPTLLHWTDSCKEVSCLPCLALPCPALPCLACLAFALPAPRGAGLVVAEVLGWGEALPSGRGVRWWLAGGARAGEDEAAAVRMPPSCTGPEQGRQAAAAGAAGRRVYGAASACASRPSAHGPPACVSVDRRQLGRGGGLRASWMQTGVAHPLLPVAVRPHSPALTPAAVPSCQVLDLVLRYEGELDSREMTVAFQRMGALFLTDLGATPDRVVAPENAKEHCARLFSEAQAQLGTLDTQASRAGGSPRPGVVGRGAAPPGRSPRAGQRGALDTHWESWGSWPPPKTFPLISSLRAHLPRRRAWRRRCGCARASTTCRRPRSGRRGSAPCGSAASTSP